MCLPKAEILSEQEHQYDASSEPKNAFGGRQHQHRKLIELLRLRIKIAPSTIYMHKLTINYGMRIKLNKQLFSCSAVAFLWLLKLG